ncbi:MAG: HAD hydrolase family protein [Candidatus Hydrothermarchaeales archaeon]
MPVICFDLEGPLSPQDNAYDVLALAENGHKIFEVISRYDDILTLEAREDYEPGDTLRLIVPFLIYHGIGEEDIKKVSKRAKIVSGVKEAVSELQNDGWDVFIISTSYQQHAHNIGEQIGISKENIACTKLEMEKYIINVGEADFSILEAIEKKILEELYPPTDDNKIKEVLDDFFFKKLKGTEMGKIFNEISVVGGQRKVNALLKFAKKAGKGLDEVVVVGDSITDFKMLGVVKENGGIAVVFNGNEYAIPYANVAMATPDQRTLLVITAAFIKGGKKETMDAVKTLEKSGLENTPVEILPNTVREILDSKNLKAKPPKFNLLEDADKDKIEEVIRIHKDMRSYMRGEAGKLG